MTDLTYLHIRGSLAENMVYRSRPGYESPRPGRRSEGDPAFQLVLLDCEGRVLLSVAPQVTASGCGNADDPLRYRVRGLLPLHPDGVAYELRRGEIRLYGVAIPSEPPTIAAPRCHQSANGLTLHWQPCEQPDSTRGSTAPANNAYGTTQDTTARRITYSVGAAMESGRRITIARGLTEPAHTVDLSLMPLPGKGTLYLVASDGVRSSEVEVASIDVPVRAPTVHILAPAPDAYLPFGQPVSVLGCCLDMGGQPCSLDRTVWSLDGERFAAGTLVAALDGLHPGPHRLTLAYEGGDYEGGHADRVEASVTLKIEEPDADYRRWEALIGDTHPTDDPRATY